MVVHEDVRFLPGCVQVFGRYIVTTPCSVDPCVLGVSYNKLDTDVRYAIFLVVGQSMCYQNDGFVE